MTDKVSLRSLRNKKERGEPITMMTAYDYPGAVMVDASGMDIILVGDSLGMVVHGFESTLSVTLEMMIMHCQAVKRGTRRAFLIGDMPFMSYQVSLEEAKRNAGRLLAEGGMDAVKVEGGAHMVETIRALVQIGIAVQGHIGLTPQSVSALGGFRAQGKSLESARTLVEDACALQEAGAFSIVLEAVPAKLAALISRRLKIPTIGIGAGVGCDGQVLVYHDILNLFDRLQPSFVKQYADLRTPTIEAMKAYAAEVASRTFPGEDHSFGISDQVWEALVKEYPEGEGL
jgi:3-methyl-2-oxobutanoate hydroxymethyltransferase